MLLGIARRANEAGESIVLSDNGRYIDLTGDRYNSAIDQLKWICWVFFGLLFVGTGIALGLSAWLHWMGWI